MSRFLMARRWVLAILVAGFVTASVDARDDGYLPRIGPMPLRFALVKPQKTHPIELFTLPVAPTPPVSTNASSTTTDAATNSPVPLVSGVQTGINSPVPHAEFVPADNMLSITPKMLNELFKANDGATNTTAPSNLPADETNFQPPSASGPPSSSATYKSE